MTDHIQIGATAPRIQYTADGVQTAFPYPFPIFAEADLEVYLGEALQSAGFTISGAGSSGGGGVAFASAPANGVLVTLRRNIAIARTSDFQEGGAFRAKVINDELDRLTASLQQVSDDVVRSLRLAPTDPSNGLVFPVASSRAGGLMGFDANGACMVYPAASFIGPQGPQGVPGTPGTGDMTSTNNLSELTSAVTARTNLGLGSAAIKDTGTAANQVVQLDANAKLPAIDGSALTNLPGVPAGVVVPFAGAAEPSGWLFCFGQAVSRATYAALFAAIGTAHGIGDGTTTFNLPDLRGRVAAGRDDMGTVAANRLTAAGSGIAGTALGAAGGSETHTLTIAQMPSHDHPGTYYDATAGANAPTVSAAGNASNAQQKVCAQGGGGAHQNTQPSLVLNYIIKI